MLIHKIFRGWPQKREEAGESTSIPGRLILIVGCYNSGTTLLNHILSQHPEISGLETEGICLTDELKGPEDFGWNRLWYKCRDQLEICQMPKPPDSTQIKKDWARHFDCSKSFALEKSIVHALNIDWFEEQFNHPHFIWIIRNGYAVSEGIRRRTIGKERKDFHQGKPYPIKWCARQWLASNAVIEHKLSAVEHFYQLRYEDLLDDYDQTLQALINWLPLQSKEFFKPDVFTFQRETKPVVNMNASSLEKLSKSDIRQINAVAAVEISRWGYEVQEGNKS